MGLDGAVAVETVQGLSFDLTLSVQLGGHDPAVQLLQSQLRHQDIRPRVGMIQNGGELLDRIKRNGVTSS